MQHDITTHPTQIFKQVLVSAAKLSPEHLNSLQTLLYSFPQCGILYTLQARSGNVTDVNAAAARFSNSAVLQKIVQQPENLPAVASSQIVIKVRKPEVELQPQLATEIITETVAETIIVTTPENETYYEEIQEVETEPIHFTNKAYEPGIKTDSITKDDFEGPVEPATKHEPLDETQKLIIENIATTDYFVFDRAFVERTDETPAAIEEDDVTPQEPAPVHQATPPPAPEEGQVTRYHDDKMPYSFMWWLDKTRNKHSGIYQPFAASSSHQVERQPPVPVPVENIPHEVIDSRKKEEELVDRFIQEDPQIKPPSSDKLDNENKARQSAEDQEELITETLARIYADQMLYSKAIAAYKILMLKNPEKRRYFASQIEFLEKKIN